VAHDHSVVDAFKSRPRPRTRHNNSDSFGGGLLVGLIGYVLTICAYAWAAFYRGGHDPHSTLASALGLLVAAGSAVTMAVVIAAIVGYRRRPAHSVGLLAGMVVGLALGLVFFLPIAGQLRDLNSHCPCDPLIKQLPVASDG
jgi:drug/metabolite transporter (DMT)-like permease